MLPKGFDYRLYSESVDFRKSINGLQMLLLEEFEGVPAKDCVYVFFNRSRNKLKVLYKERQGYCLWQKRIDKRCFRLPPNLSKLHPLKADEFLWLRLGLDLRVFEEDAARAVGYYY